MDKEFIHIDELVRGRLSGGEAKEPPGSWTRMEALLDEHMPSKPRGGAAPLWRKRLAYLGGWLLVSTAAVGGYYLLAEKGMEEAHHGQRATTSVTVPIHSADERPHSVPYHESENESGNESEKSSQLVDNQSTKQGYLNKKSNGISEAPSQKIMQEMQANKAATPLAPSANYRTPAAGQVDIAASRTADGMEQDVQGARRGVSALNQTNQMDPMHSEVSGTSGNAEATLGRPDEMTSGQADDRGLNSSPDGRKSERSNLLTVNELAKESESDELDNNPPSEAQNERGAVEDGAMDKDETALARAFIPNSPHSPFSSNIESGIQSGVADLPPTVDLQEPREPGVVPGIGEADLTVGEAQRANLSQEVSVSSAGTAPQEGRKNQASVSDQGHTASLNSLKRDTMKRIETRKSWTAEGRWQTDTVDMGVAEYLRQDAEPGDLAVKPTTAISGSALSLQHTDMSREDPAMTNQQDAQWVPLSDYRVVTQKTRTHYRKARFFEEMVRNAKFQLGRARFYPGLVAGVHSSLSKYSMSGFQIGATGNLSLNDKWGIHTAIRYKHSFNGKVYQDESYIGSLDTTYTQQGSMISYDSVSLQFQYSTISRFELPLMVSYSLKRWVILGGGVLHHQLAIDAQDVSKTFNQQFYQGLRSVNLEHRSPGIHVEDFGARWGASGMLGVGFQISPAIRLDARWTQPIWNDTQSPGARRLSQSIFDRPQAEIHMNFRFSSNRYKPFRAPN